MGGSFGHWIQLPLMLGTVQSVNIIVPLETLVELNTFHIVLVSLISLGFHSKLESLIAVTNGLEEFGSLKSIYGLKVAPGKTVPFLLVLVKRSSINLTPIKLNGYPLFLVRDIKSP